jgi:hypothetical protein
MVRQQQLAQALGRELLVARVPAELVLEVLACANAC